MKYHKLEFTNSAQNEVQDMKEKLKQLSDILIFFLMMTSFMHNTKVYFDVDSHYKLFKDLSNAILTIKFK